MTPSGGISTTIGRGLDDVVFDIGLRPAAQQPEWEDERLVERVREELAGRPSLVAEPDVRTLRSLLARVAAGELLVVQSGDCAEDPQECTRPHVARKAALLDMLAGTLRMTTQKPVLRVGRIAGQFCKPRSHLTERVGDVELPVFRGHLVNGPEPLAEFRRPNPMRILTGYTAARDVMTHLGWYGPAGRPVVDAPVWTSHEALLLDYELPMLRPTDDGGLLLASTHWPWVGERTRQVDGAHVAMLAEVVNPVACKVGPLASVDEVLALCERLDPHREPGRLTLIARMGARAVADRLPPLVHAVREAGHPVIWLCDPMHGNTVITAEGRKTRPVDAMVREVQEFQHALRRAGGVAGGLHLEATPDEVVECVRDESSVGCVAGRYTTFCDPRLNMRQAVYVAWAWR